MSLSLNYPFTNPSNYTYNTDEITITGTASKLKDQRPPDSTFYVNYNTDVNGNWGNGVLTGSPVGGAGVLSGRLYLAFNDSRHVNYDAIANADSIQTGCIRLRYIPIYNGAPPSSFHMFSIGKADSDLKNVITLAHFNTGQLNLGIFDKDGIGIIQQNLGAWSVSNGTSYEIELNWNLTDGATRVFVNGIQFGATQTQTGTRDSNIGLFRVGNNYDATKISNFSINDIIIYSTVQHTANYTPDWSNIPETIYLKTNPETIYNAQFRTDSLESFVETSTKTGNDEVKYILRKDGVYYYHDGNSWVISDGTYAQANTAAEINTNASTYTTIPVDIQITDFKHSDDGSTTPILSNVEVTYDFAGQIPTLTEVTIWSFLRSLDSPLEGIEVKVRPVWVIGDTTIITGDFITQTTNGNGYFEFDMLIEDVDPTYLEWNIKDKIYKTNFINQSIVKFSELTILYQNETDIDLLGV